MTFDWASPERISKKLKSFGINVSADTLRKGSTIPAKSPKHIKVESVSHAQLMKVIEAAQKSGRDRAYPAYPKPKREKSLAEVWKERKEFAKKQFGIGG